MDQRIEVGIDLHFSAEIRTLRDAMRLSVREFAQPTMRRVRTCSTTYCIDPSASSHPGENPGQMGERWDAALAAMRAVEQVAPQELRTRPAAKRMVPQLAVRAPRTVTTSTRYR
jgi:hypothetical protein